MSHRREVEFRGNTNRRVTSYSPALENRAPWLLQALFGEQVCNTSCYMPYLQCSVLLQPHGRYWAGYPEGCPPLGHHTSPREFKQIEPSCLFLCGIETPKTTDRGSRLITEMHLGKESVSWQASTQGCRCSLPKAKKHIITREVLRATGQFLLSQDTRCGSHCWRFERDRGMRASNLRCPSAEPLMLWFTGMRTGSQYVWVRWKASKNPGQYWAAGVGEKRLLSHPPGMRFAGKTQELTSAEHRGGLHFPFDLTVFFHFCDLNSVLKTCHVFHFSGHSWGVTHAWGWQPSAIISTEVVDWHRESLQEGERHFCFWSCLSQPQPAEVSSTGACAAGVGEQLWQRWIKPPAKNRQAKGLE